MQYLSTRNNKLKESFLNVFFQGLSKEGGLFLPTHWPKISLVDLKGITYEELAYLIIKPYLGKDIPDIEEVLEKHYNEYEETARVQAQYNRLSMYSPYTMHAPTSYGDKTRYTLRCFITRIEAPHETYPLNRRT